jgi:4'-phosphopantetheinyl transferase
MVIFILKVVIMRFNEIPEEIFNYFLPHISMQRKTKISRLVKKVDKDTSLMSEILIRHVISEELDVESNKFNIKEDTYGKPYSDNIQNLYFNISHSQDWIVCAISSFPVGVDIEKIRPINFIDISKLYFTSDEYKLIAAKKLKEQQDTFYRLWTLKESLIKANGKGLFLPLKSFSIEISNGKPNILYPYSLQSYSLKEFQFDPEYKLSTCTIDNQLLYKVEIIKVLQKELIYKFKEKIYKCNC